jgi:hypothetical protein
MYIREKNIVRVAGWGFAALAVVYAVWTFVTWDQAPRYAPLATACIALGAAIVAGVAIYAQRDIARRRASIDFFLKTETDEKLIELYYRVRAIPADQFDVWARCADFTNDPRYKDVRSFLNICELIAVGVREKAFSTRVSYAYWGDVLPQTFHAARPLIERIRATPGEGTRYTYLDLQLLCREWAELAPPLNSGSTS